MKVRYPGISCDQLKQNWVSNELAKETTNQLLTEETRTDGRPGELIERMNHAPVLNKDDNYEIIGFDVCTVLVFIRIR